MPRRFSASAFARHALQVEAEVRGARPGRDLLGIHGSYGSPRTIFRYCVKSVIASPSDSAGPQWSPSAFRKAKHLRLGMHARQPNSES